MIRVLSSALEHYKFPVVLLDKHDKIIAFNIAFMCKVDSKQRFLELLHDESNDIYDTHITDVVEGVKLVQILNMSTSAFNTQGLITDNDLNILDTHGDNVSSLGDILPSDILVDLSNLRKNIEYSHDNHFTDHNRHVSKFLKIFRNDYGYQFEVYEGDIHASQLSDFDVDVISVLNSLGFGYMVMDVSGGNSKVDFTNDAYGNFFDIEASEMVSTPRKFINRAGRLIDDSDMPCYISREAGMNISNYVFTSLNENTNVYVWLNTNTVLEDEKVYLVFHNVTTELFSGHNSTCADIYAKQTLGVLPVGIAIVDNDKIEYANPLLLSYMTEDIVGQDIKTLITDSSENIVKFRCKDGDKRMQYVTMPSSHGKVMYVFSDVTRLHNSYVDMWEYTKTLEQLVHDRRAEVGRLNDLYNSIVDELPVGIWIADKEGNITFANKHFQRMFNGVTNIHDIFDSYEDKNLFSEHLNDPSKNEMVFQKLFNGIEWIKIKFFLRHEKYIGTTDNVTSQYQTISRIITLQRDFKELFDGVRA